MSPDQSAPTPPQGKRAQQISDAYEVAQIVSRLRDYSDWDGCRWGQQIEEAADKMEALANAHQRNADTIADLTAALRDLINEAVPLAVWCNTPKAARDADPTFHSDLGAVAYEVEKAIDRARAALAKAEGGR